MVGSTGLMSIISLPTRNRIVPQHYERDAVVTPRLIGLLAAMVAAGAGYTLYWYEQLSAAEKAEADSLAIQYAKDLYSKALHELTTSQLGMVHRLVKDHFTS
jgi:hypothetical protein